MRLVWSILNNPSYKNKKCISIKIFFRFGEKHISLVKTYNLMGVVQHLADEPHNAIEYYE